MDQGARRRQGSRGRCRQPRPGDRAGEVIVWDTGTYDNRDGDLVYAGKVGSRRSGGDTRPLACEMTRRPPTSCARCLGEAGLASMRTRA
jgi:hypothetical protein